MKRRTKLDMQWMKEDVTEWLLKSNNDPHKAWDEYCKHLVMNNNLRSHYIRGKEDFLKVSKEIGNELKIKEHAEIVRKQKAENEEAIINYIMKLSKEEIKAIYKQYKDIVSYSDKLVIIDVCSTIWSDYKYTSKDIDQRMINVFNNIYNEQLQPA